MKWVIYVSPVCTYILYATITTEETSIYLPKKLAYIFVASGVLARLVHVLTP